MHRCMDFSLRNVVRVRLLDASPREEALVRRQLGPLDTPMRGEADICIRFVDSLSPNSPLRYLGDAEFAYSDDAFFVLRGKHKSPVMVQLPVDSIGGPLEIVCCRGVTAVPYLIALVNLTALAKGFLPLHASAIRYQQSDVLITGWAKGGKTESVLGFVDRGASYIGDEWIYLGGNGQEMVGIPEPIRLWDWHLRNLPQLRARLTAKQRLKLGALRLASAITNVVGRRSLLMRRVAGVLHRQRYVQVSPLRLFGEARCEQGRPDVLFFVVSRDSPDYEVLPISSEEVASRMQFSLLDELSDVLACYLRYRFAFPQRRCQLLDELPGRLHQRLIEALGAIPAYLVLHPYPVCPRAMFKVMNHYAAGAQNRHPVADGEKSLAQPVIAQ